MRILFILDHADVFGGVETLAARLSHRFLKDKAIVEVAVLSNCALPDVLRCFPDGTKFTFFDHEIINSFRLPYGIRNNIAIFNEPFDGIITYSLESFYCSEMFKLHHGLLGQNIFYVVNPHAIKGQSPNSFRLSFFRKRKTKFIAFMNQECKDSFCKVLTVPNGSSSIIPIPIVPLPMLHCEPSCRRIVSIGRIEPVMKNYSWNVIAEIKKLHSNYPDLIWDIYGTGKLENMQSLEKTINEHGCQDFIKLRGPFAYEYMSDVLENTFAFIGMGTAALEAASAGIPSIVSIAYSDSPISHGMLHELPFGNLGEINNSLKINNIGSILNSLLHLDNETYQSIRKESRQCASRFNIENNYNSIISMFDESEPIIRGASNCKFVHTFHLFLGFILRKIRRILSLFIQGLKHRYTLWRISI